MVRTIQDKYCNFCGQIFTRNSCNSKYCSRGCRFMSKVSPNRETGCWEWTASCNGCGYGSFNDEGRIRKAHHVAYEFYRGPIPKWDGYHGACICHTCDNRSCVNPKHLFIATNTENHQDKKRKGRGARGDTNGKSILTEKQVITIKSRISNGDVLAQIARDNGVHANTIHAINRGVTWCHVKT